MMGLTIEDNIEPWLIPVKIKMSNITQTTFSNVFRSVTENVKTPNQVQLKNALGV